MRSGHEIRPRLDLIVFDYGRPFWGNILRKKDWQTTQETAYDLCTRKLNAKEANKDVRNHWGIEHRIHYVRNTPMDEYERILVSLGCFGLLHST